MKKLKKNKKESDGFLIEHISCGAIFTIDSKQFVETHKGNKEFKCPNCHTALINYDPEYHNDDQKQKTSLGLFTGFLTTYNHLTGELEGLTIREIQNEELEVIKSPYKRFK